MTYQSVDKLQNYLAQTVFHYTRDSKKAAGRALGTLVELISFYVLNDWNLSHFVSIETRLIEYGNPTITHNVEYSLHPIERKRSIVVSPVALPITISSMLKSQDKLNDVMAGYKKINNALVSRDLVLRNSCTVGQSATRRVLAFLDEFCSKQAVIHIVEQSSKPFAMVECKRVGVEEGIKKGPQTIEKAKQGAYVARIVSSLQKIRNNDGDIFGVIAKKDGSFYYKKYINLLEEVINSSDPALLTDFMLTIGVVSNHGNWFTTNDPNKELKVLAQSYDWLIFLSDEGLATFIDDLILNAKNKYKLVRDAFIESYSGQHGKNKFTKVKIDLVAHNVLTEYFLQNRKKIEKWFKILNPIDKSITHLKEQLLELTRKDWASIFSES